MEGSVAKRLPGRVSRSIAHSIREGLTVDEMFDGDDLGLIGCWEQGRKLANAGSTLVSQALDNELPRLNTWRRGTLNYLAVWQGLRGEDLDIDPGRDFLQECSLTRRPWCFSLSHAERDEAQEKINSQYLREATLEWCWNRGKELAAQRHRLLESAALGELKDLVLFPRGTLQYYALWQGLRGFVLDIDKKESFAVRCSRTGRWWVFGPDTRPEKKWKLELQKWLDDRNPDAVESDEVEDA